VTGLQKSTARHGGEATHGEYGASITIGASSWFIGIDQVPDAIRVMNDAPAGVDVVAALDDVLLATRPKQSIFWKTLEAMSEWLVRK